MGDRGDSCKTSSYKNREMSCIIVRIEASALVKLAYILPAVKEFKNDRGILLVILLAL